jgi:hypothetical protein
VSAQENLNPNLGLSQEKANFGTGV